ncbi:hypothetical protein DAI22_02g079100 [Oryza sativa Japonica Group]|nr:hypothetical protein DAI22_02g079100 [Oryza sativa Japonica Group]
MDGVMVSWRREEEEKPKGKTGRRRRQWPVANGVGDAASPPSAKWPRASGRRGVGRGVPVSGGEDEVDVDRRGVARASRSRSPLGTGFIDNPLSTGFSTAPSLAAIPTNQSVGRFCRSAGGDGEREGRRRPARERAAVVGRKGTAIVARYFSGVGSAGRLMREEAKPPLAEEQRDLGVSDDGKVVDAASPMGSGDYESDATWWAHLDDGEAGGSGSVLRPRDPDEKLLPEVQRGTVHRRGRRLQLAIQSTAAPRVTGGGGGDADRAVAEAQRLPRRLRLWFFFRRD